MSYCNNKEYDARRMKDHEAEDRAGDTKQSREDWIASVIAERDLYKGECALLLEAKKSAHSQMEYLRQQLWEMRTNNRMPEADNVSEQIAWYHQSHSREQVLWWVQERLDNCQSIASVKKGVDREGWMDDASYFAAILSLLTKST